MPDEPDIPELAHFRARLDRAADLYGQVGSAWEAYLERHPHRLVIKMRSGGRGELLMERLIRLPEEVALLLGEYLYQLRSALDNCLYAVAIIAAGTAPPPGACRPTTLATNSTSSTATTPPTHLHQWCRP